MTIKNLNQSSELDEDCQANASTVVNTNNEHSQLTNDGDVTDPKDNTADANDEKTSISKDEIYSALIEYSEIIALLNAINEEDRTDEDIEMLKNAEEIYTFFSKAENTQILNRSCQLTKSGIYGKIIRIISFNKDTQQVDKVMIQTYSHNCDTLTVELSSIKILPFLPHSSRLEGLKVDCLFDEDGEWYSAEIRKLISDTEARIFYTDYHCEDDVLLDRLRLAKKVAKTDNDSTITTVNGYQIPHSLLVKPGDSLEVKAMKKHKLEALKYEQKQQKKEQEAIKRKSSWQQHLQSKKRKF